LRVGACDAHTIVEVAADYGLPAFSDHFSRVGHLAAEFEDGGDEDGAERGAEEDENPRTLGGCDYGGSAGEDERQNRPQMHG
jgi:hypothetical protein